MEEERKDGIKVTPEMVEAGLRALWERTYLAEFPKDADRLCVIEILESALHARPTKANDAER